MTNLEYVLGGCVLLFGIVGFISGAARQLARIFGFAAAYFAAGPCGTFLSIPLAEKLATPLSIATIIGTVFSFVLIFITVQLVLTAILRRLFRPGEKNERTGFDRVFGFVLGASMAAAFWYVGLCAASFFENSVSVGGQRLVFTPKNSAVMGFVREHNIMRYQHFSGIEAVVNALKASKNPAVASKIKSDSDLMRLLNDSRFKSLLESKDLKRAMESGQLDGLLSNNQLIEALNDAVFMDRVERLADLR